MKRAVFLGAAASLMTTTALAQSGDAPSDAALVAAAEQKMGVTFQNMSIVDFREAPLPGLYQADIGGRIVYYSPDPEALIFGQIFDKNGVDLTAKALQETHAKRQALVDLGDALAIGPAGAPEFVEFSNPDCGYCRLLNNYVLTEEEQGRPVRRKIIFTGLNESALSKATHILCSDDPARAFNEIYNGRAPNTLNDCPQGRARAERHAQMAKAAGIQGTPTLWLDGRPVEGFRQGELAAFLQSKR